MFDAHAHVISPDVARYPRASMKGGAPQSEPEGIDASAESLIAKMDASGVRQACAVQRAFIYGFDNSYILDACRQYPDRLLPVLVVDATDPATPAMLRTLARSQRLGGIRLSAPVPQPRDVDWLSSREAMDTWRTADELGLPIAVIMFRTQRKLVLQEIGSLAKRFPKLPIVIDHVGIPHGTIYDGPFAKVPESSHPAEGAPTYGVDTDLLRLADLQNIFFKITSINFRRLAASGVALASFVCHLASTFGVDRLMWGSDIGQTPGTYDEMARAARQSVDALALGERKQVLWGTACSVYRGSRA